MDPGHDLDDPHVFPAVQEYLAAPWRPAASPDRDAFVARFPGRRPALAECLGRPRPGPRRRPEAPRRCPPADRRRAADGVGHFQHRPRAGPRWDGHHLRRRVQLCSAPGGALKVLPLRGGPGRSAAPAVQERGPGGRPPAPPEHRPGVRRGRRAEHGVHFYAMQLIKDRARTWRRGGDLHARGPPISRTQRDADSAPTGDLRPGPGNSGPRSGRSLSTLGPSGRRVLQDRGPPRRQAAEAWNAPSQNGIVRRDIDRRSDRRRPRQPL